MDFKEPFFLEILSFHFGIIPVGSSWIYIFNIYTEIICTKYSNTEIFIFNKLIQCGFKGSQKTAQSPTVFCA
jgi:hypothetical protein